MGHITHLRKHFKSINTYDYIIMLIKRRKKDKLYENFLVLHLNKIHGCFMPSLVEISPVVLEKRIFKFCQCIFAIS